MLLKANEASLCPKQLAGKGSSVLFPSPGTEPTLGTWCLWPLSLHLTFSNPNKLRCLDMTREQLDMLKPIWSACSAQGALAVLCHKPVTRFVWGGVTVRKSTMGPLSGIKVKCWCFPFSRRGIVFRRSRDCRPPPTQEWTVYLRCCHSHFLSSRTKELTPPS